MNSLGFLTEGPKKATIILPCSDFTVKKVSDHTTVYSGRAAGPLSQQEFDRQVWIADFSEVKERGKILAMK